MVELDGLRGIAVGLILIQHYCGSLIPEGSSFRWLSEVLVLCRTGVDLFFVLSGFLIGGIVLDHRNSPNLLPVFYLRRAFRILPLYGVVFVAFLIGRAAGASGVLFDGPIPAGAYATFTQNYVMAYLRQPGALWMGVTWTLAIEEQFYLGFPWLVRWTAPGKIAVMLSSGAVLAVALRIWAYLHFGDYYEASFWLLCRMDALFAGALLACAIRNPRAAKWLDAHKRWLVAALAVFSTGLVALSIGANRDIAFHMALWGFTWLVAFYATALGCVVLYQGCPGTGFLRSAWLVRLGLISYGVYLVHPISLHLVFGAMNRVPVLAAPRDFWPILTALVVTIAFTAATYRWMEEPLRAVARRARYA